MFKPGDVVVLSEHSKQQYWYSDFTTINGFGPFVVARALESYGVLVSDLNGKIITQFTAETDVGGMGIWHGVFTLSQFLTAARKAIEKKGVTHESK